MPRVMKILSDSEFLLDPPEPAFFRGYDSVAWDAPTARPTTMWLTSSKRWRTSRDAECWRPNRCGIPWLTHSSVLERVRDGHLQDARRAKHTYCVPHSGLH